MLRGEPLVRCDLARLAKYDNIILMVKTEKVAVTVDREVLGAAERLRQKTGESRSALVNRALRLLVSDDARRAQVAQYVPGYREHPETDDDVAVARELAAATLKALPWK